MIRAFSFQLFSLFVQWYNELRGPSAQKNFIHKVDVIGPSDYEFAISFFIIPTVSKL